MKSRMKESYREYLASRSGHEPYAGSSNVPGVAWGSGDAGQPLSSEIRIAVFRVSPRMVTFIHNFIGNVTTRAAIPTA